jgi:hypothetical protein
VTDPFAEFDAPDRAATSEEAEPDRASSHDGDAGERAADPATADDASSDPIAHQRRRRWPGIWSFWIAISMIFVTGVAIGLASAGEAVVALTLTISALGLSGIAFVLGLVAIFGNFSRMLGIVGAGIALVINPVALLYGLSALGAF